MPHSGGSCSFSINNSYIEIALNVTNVCARIRATCVSTKHTHY